MGRVIGKHADLLSPDAMRDDFSVKVDLAKGEALDREKICASFSHERPRAGLRLPARQRGVPHDRERARSCDRRRGTEPREAEARDALAALRAGAPAGTCLRGAFSRSSFRFRQSARTPRRTAMHGS